MIYPDHLKEGDKIGVCAPSHSIDNKLDKLRFENGKKKLKEKGYDVIFTDHVFCKGDAFGRSSDGKTKAKEFMQLIRDKEVKAVISASGGDFLAELLKHLDAKAIKKNPKWVQGYSDNTSLLYFLTTKLDIATAYGANFGDFGMEPWQPSVKRNLEILEGKRKSQESFARYQSGFSTRTEGYEGYSLDKRVKWKNIYGGVKVPRELKNVKPSEMTKKQMRSLEGGKVSMKGRLIGGCMDVILNLAGTPYDGTLQFMEKYKKDGFIWYLESFDLGFEQMMEGLWKMNEMGWFRYVKGFIFGRPLFYPDKNFSGEPIPEYNRVLLEQLAPLNVPVIADADIGHKGPQFIMINGAMAKIESEGGKGSLTYLKDR